MENRLMGLDTSSDHMRPVRFARFVGFVKISLSVVEVYIYRVAPLSLDKFKSPRTHLHRFDYTLTIHWLSNKYINRIMPMYAEFH
jgi:hypothetical protein